MKFLVPALCLIVALFPGGLSARNSNGDPANVDRYGIPGEYGGAYGLVGYPGATGGGLPGGYPAGYAADFSGGVGVGYPGDYNGGYASGYSNYDGFSDNGYGYNVYNGYQ